MKHNFAAHTHTHKCVYTLSFDKSLCVCTHTHKDLSIEYNFISNGFISSVVFLVLIYTNLHIEYFVHVCTRYW